MKLTELITDPELFRPAGAAPRSPGCHVSDVIRSLENEVTKPGKRKPVAELSREELRRMGGYTLGGFAWEELIRQAVVSMYLAHGDRFLYPGELERDGIFGSPDWFDTHDWLVEEFKATWRSSRRSIETDFWSWWVQIKAYCWMLETRAARLRVFFVNGDYRDSGPQIKQYQAIFEEEELEQNWHMILQHAQEKGMIE